MKKYPVVLMALWWLFCVRCEVFGNGGSWVEIGRGNMNIRAILFDPDNPQTIYIGLDKAVLKTTDGGLNWRNVLVLRAQGNGVNVLLSDQKDKHVLYAATGIGLFYSNNQGGSWRRIFGGKSGKENVCKALLLSKSAIYVGTGSGLFISKDHGRTWNRAAGKIGNSHILSIASPKEADVIYLASVEGAFKSENSGSSWNKIFSANNTENEDQEIDMDNKDDQEEKMDTSDIRYLCLDAEHPDSIYLATLRGIYKSMDRGLSWEAIASYGMLNKDVRLLLSSLRQRLYAVTRRGIFEYHQERWEELSLRLTADEFYTLNLDNQDNIYAGCNNGLFKAPLKYLSGYAESYLVSARSQGEPEIREIQKAAAKYAEVEPEKIMRWRKQAAKRAWLPKVTAAINRDVGDLWHWETGSTTKGDDDALRKGSDSIAWDMSLSWDLGELIWNSDQTSIDVRSRLMVELRDDILDEVNRVYFERLRVKMDLENMDIVDVKKRQDKEIRLKELTASLDALTGGYFSKETGRLQAMKVGKKEVYTNHS